MKNTYIYAFPLDRLPRNSKTEDIIKDYNRDDLPADQLPVKKYTIEEFCELINDDMFNDQEYYARAVEEDEEEQHHQKSAQRTILLNQECIDHITLRLLQ